MYTTASGVPVPQGTDAFSPATQFKNWADKAATYENRVVVALDSDRLALATPVLRDGLECYVTGTQIIWLYEGTTWVNVSPPVDTGWTALTLVSSWTNYGSGYGVARCRRIGSRVQVAGLIKGGTGTIGTLITTLPTGFRPSSNEMYTIHNGSNGIKSAQVSTDGTIAIAQAVTNSELSLANITFLVD
jgi:hypothetical protein